MEAVHLIYFCCDLRQILFVNNSEGRAQSTIWAQDSCGSANATPSRPAVSENFTLLLYSWISFTKFSIHRYALAAPCISKWCLVFRKCNDRLSVSVVLFFWRSSLHFPCHAVVSIFFLVTKFLNKKNGIFFFSDIFVCDLNQTTDLTLAEKTFRNRSLWLVMKKQAHKNYSWNAQSSSPKLRLFPFYGWIITY